MSLVASGKCPPKKEMEGTMLITSFDEKRFPAKRVSFTLEASNQGEQRNDTNDAKATAY